MEQLPLIHEDWREALRHTINTLGGPKEVGLMLKPSMKRDEAGRWISDCINPDRAAKLDLEEIQHILREARKIGCHTAMVYLAQDTGYQATPIAPEDEQDELMRQFIEAQKAMGSIVRRMDSLQPRLRPNREAS